MRHHFGRYPAFIRLTMAVWTTVRGALQPSARSPIFHLGARQHALADFLRGRYGPPPAALVEP